MTVPYTFGTATTSIPLSNLDANFNTPITLGNTSIYLGNTTTTIGNLTLTNATISSGNVTLTNVSVTTANVTNITVSGTANIATGNVTTLTSTSITDSGLTSGRVTYASASGLLTDSANLLYSGTDLTVYGVRVGRGGGAVSTNTAVGASALGNASNTGANNAAFGSNVLGVNTSGGTNAGFGINSLAANLTGSSNAGFGVASLSANTTGSYNVACGQAALQNNDTASNNTAVGYQAGYSNISGANLVAVGYKAGYTSNASNSTYVGYFAGQETTGILNTFLGVNGVGYLVSSGTRNTIIGAYDGNMNGLDIRTASNYVVLSDGDGNRQITMKEGQTLALDSAVPNSGTGITFPATQSASSDANTLDDYEEGTWTPTIIAGGGTGSPTYASNIGKYTKIGNTVFATAFISFTKNTLSGGTLQSGGLPFAGANSYYPIAACYINIGTLIVNPLCQVGANSTTIDVAKSNAVTGAIEGVTIANLGAGDLELRYTVTYQVN